MYPTRYLVDELSAAAYMLAQLWSAPPTQSEKESPASPRTQRQPQCTRQRSLMIFPTAWPSPSQRFSHFFLAAAPCLPCKPCVLRLLRTLFLSLHSFRRSPRLFSIACGLFLQNTGGWGASATSPRPPRLPVLQAGLCIIICRFFVAPLFSWSYKLLFPQALYFDNHLRCPPGVGSALLSQLSPSFSTALINFGSAANFLFAQARVIVLTFRGDYVR